MTTLIPKSEAVQVGLRIKTILDLGMVIVSVRYNHAVDCFAIISVYEDTILKSPVGETDWAKMGTDYIVVKVLNGIVHYIPRSLT